MGCLLQSEEKPTRHVNQSELTTYLRCRRKWDWQYVKGLESPGYQTNLATGSAVHAGLQAHYKDEDPFAAITAYWLPVVEGISPDDPNMAQVAKDVKLSNIMMEGYLEWLLDSNEDAGYTPIAIEEKVEMLLTPDITLHGTLDLVQMDGDGNMWLIDHKTTNAFGVLVDRRMQLNFQLLTYALLCQDFFGKPPTGAKLNMLRKVQRTAASKPPFYQRETVHFNQHQLDNHKRHLLAILNDLDGTEAEIRSGNDAVAWPVVDGDCTWKCPFLSVCAFADDGSDIEGALNDLYVRSDKSGRNI